MTNQDQAQGGLTPDDIYSVYRITHDDEGDSHYQVAGRYCFLGDEVAVLEDPFDLLKGMDGVVNAQKIARLRALGRSAYLCVVRRGDMRLCGKAQNQTLEAGNGNAGDDAAPGVGPSDAKALPEPVNKNETAMIRV